jgi:hypothetical protein
MTSKFSKPIPIRLLRKDEVILGQLAEVTGISMSRLVRIAVRLGLPGLTEQLAPGLPEEEVKK